MAKREIRIRFDANKIANAEAIDAVFSFMVFPVKVTYQSRFTISKYFTVTKRDNRTCTTYTVECAK